MFKPGDSFWQWLDTEATELQNVPWPLFKEATVKRSRFSQATREEPQPMCGSAPVDQKLGMNSIQTSPRKDRLSPLDRLGSLFHRFQKEIAPLLGR